MYRVETKVEIFLCARDLAEIDLFCIVYMESAQLGQYIEVGRTEAKSNSVNPNWSKTIQVGYYFEKRQNLRFILRKSDEGSADILGEAFATLGELIGRKGPKILELAGNSKLIVKAEEVKNIKDVLKFKMKGENLDEKDWFGKSDPYLIIYRSLDNDTWVEIFKSEVIKNTTNPFWNEFKIPINKLCNGDLKKPIKIDCYDWDSIGSDDLIGSTITDLEHLSRNGWRFELQTPEKRLKGENTGEIVVMEMTVKKVFSFLEYLRSGIQLNFCVAVDFTNSNQVYTKPKSMHYLNPQMPNQYEKAIWEIGSILEAYDSNNCFSIYGFGGIPNGEKAANHCFPLTFDKSNPYVNGAQGLLEAYRRSLPLVTLSGPTLFKPIIENTISVAKSQPPHVAYHVLLILTDGEIMDIINTISQIVDASNLPISIIIVGVGKSSFSSMEQLHCDIGVLKDERGIKVARDIVQFVPFNKFDGNPVLLAEEVLKKIPIQITEYMLRIGYIPPVPEPVDFETFYTQNFISQNANIQDAPVQRVPEEKVSAENAYNQPVQVADSNDLLEVMTK
ncbi:hypothetical protein SteCoe_14707 [Stentor coeruleus]|uniref:C2 domain-containing protein n=1 Tax=Stentor coeruleus TaxID=5963 RepID=A0A1R2C5F7_9CILI|nr:hypothetical protein SteCoe_14707 [Stentor coeruleus]